MKLEKFDLEKVIHGAKVVTRDGREVTELSKFNTYRKLCLYGVVDDEVECWTIDGQYSEGVVISNMDLFIEYQVQSVWVNVYRNKYNSVYTGQSYTSKEHALNRIDTTVEYIKTIEITDEV
jgi:hypothetical protein